MSKDLIFELGTEEIPHEILTNTLIQLKQIALDKLKEAGIEFGKINVYGTPRRLALLLNDVEEHTKQKTVEKKGPPVKVAYDSDGKPTRALEGFLKGQGISIDDIEKKEIGGNFYVVVNKTKGGEAAVDILPKILKNTILSIHFPKTMRWATYQTAFVRPIRWIVSLFGADVLDMQIENVSASNESYGHRLLSNKVFALKGGVEYKSQLKEVSVIVDQEERKKIIRAKIEKAAERLKALPVLDDKLLDTLVNLCESPKGAVGIFEKKFLELPKEVLISEMIDHQKYVPLTNQDGDLINNFIVVINNEPNDNIVKGNERVIRARFSDGKFFFDEDKKKNFADNIEALKNVAYARKLGSLYDKMQRMKKIVSAITEQVGFSDDRDNALRVAELCKADLVTNMVNEFDELQGVMGNYYATFAGEPQNVALAIEEHYYPRYSGDVLPSNNEGLLVSLADRIDNLFAMYSQGKYVTGSKDPFALRRQTLGIIRILIEKKLHLDFAKLFDVIESLYMDFIAIDKNEFRSQILKFITSRIKTIFKEYDFNYDEIEAGITGDVSDIYDSYLRITAIHEARQSDDFANLAVAFKRVKNIIKKEKVGTLDKDLFAEEAEKALYKVLAENEKSFIAALDERDYAKSVSILTSFREPVDKFFDDVLVMAEDEKIKTNRITLLSKIDKLFLKFIDFDKIVVE